MSSNVPTIDPRAIRKILKPQVYHDAMIRSRDAYGQAGLGIMRGDEDLRKHIFLAMREVRKSGALRPFAHGAEMKIREVIAWNLFVGGDNGVPRDTMMSTPLAFAIYSGASYAAAERAREIRAERAPAPRRRRRAPDAEFSFAHMAFFTDKTFSHRVFSFDDADLMSIAEAASEGAVQAACGNVSHESCVDLFDHDVGRGQAVVLPVTRESVFRPLVARLGRFCGSIMPLSADSESPSHA